MNRLRRFAGPVGLIVATLLLSSCGIFSDKEDEELEPKELVKLQNKLKIKKLWTAKVGGDSEFLLVGLRPVGDGNRIYAAGAGGNVIAVDPQSGKQHWKTELDVELSAGPAVGDGTVVVGSKDGIVIALDANSGAEQWRVIVGGEMLCKAVIDFEPGLVALDHFANQLGRRLLADAMRDVAHMTKGRGDMAVGDVGS